MILKARAPLIIIALLLSAGCAREYVYTPPPTEEGIKCAAQCQARQEACRNQQADSAAAAQRRCNSDSSAEYEQCLVSAEEAYGNCQEETQTEYYACLKYAEKRSSCVQESCTKKSCYKKSCRKSPNYGVCDSEFRACYQQCGGKVEIMK